jgi:hypothetical protein
VAKFIITDVFGRTVIGPFAAWDHVLEGHPEMDGREELVKEAIIRPVSVHATRDPARRLFRGKTITSGFFSGSSPRAVVEYDRSDIGYLRTAYLDNLDPIVKVLWL